VVVSDQLVAAGFSSVPTAGLAKEATNVNRLDDPGWETFRLGVAEAVQKRLPIRQTQGGRDSSKTAFHLVNGDRELYTVMLNAPADQEPELMSEVPPETVYAVSLPDVPEESPTSDTAQESGMDLFVRLHLLGVAALASTLVLGRDRQAEDA
jgi:hypothetical protein